LNISAQFLISAAGPDDFPRGELAEVAMVGRSNVGKSSLINALVRQKVARTSAEPGKTRLANVYRVARGASPPFLLVDLPGYGYARRDKGGSVPDFEALAGAYFVGREGREGLEGREGKSGRKQSTTRSNLPGLPDLPAHPARHVAALLLVDARHPGLANDRAAWQWLRRAARPTAVVGTKIDKLARGERIRVLKQLESAFEDTVLPVSAVTGEGLDELWKLIDRLANSRSHQHPAQ
jgi:GTP-binding protein